MKKKKFILITKQIFLLLLFIIGMCYTYVYIDKALCLKTEHGIMQSRTMYDQPRNSIDVVFMGSSHIHCDINTAMLWEQHGIAAYDYSAAEQPLWITYYYLKELCKYQKPKLVVLDLYSPARFKDDYQYQWLNDNLMGVRFGINKLNMLYASCEPQYYADYFPGIVRYHNRFKTYDGKDIDYVLASKEERATFKGYTPYFVEDPQVEPELTQSHSGGITIKSEQYLQKIIEYTKKNDIELFLIVSPYITTDEDELVYNRVHEIASNYGLEFNSTNYFYDEMELDFEKDFNDESHLNYTGSCKFTEYLGKVIKKKYDIPDRRGLKKWRTWDLHAKDISERAKQYKY